MAGSGSQSPISKSAGQRTHKLFWEGCAIKVNCKRRNPAVLDRENFGDITSERIAHGRAQFVASQGTRFLPFDQEIPHLHRRHHGEEAPRRLEVSLPSPDFLNGTRKARKGHVLGKERVPPL